MSYRDPANTVVSPKMADLVAEGYLALPSHLLFRRVEALLVGPGYLVTVIDNLQPTHPPFSYAGMGRPFFRRHFDHVAPGAVPRGATSSSTTTFFVEASLDQIRDAFFSETPPAPGTADVGGP